MAAKRAEVPERANPGAGRAELYVELWGRDSLRTPWVTLLSLINTVSDKSPKKVLVPSFL